MNADKNSNKSYERIVSVMGISASQARLLTITARLTSNEYESQQISNAKMRLATQSQQASSEYIAALNSRKLMFTSYDAHGDAVSAPLTAAALYQYSDLKNQYALVNAHGQMLLSSEDARNYEASKNLSEFLEKYGIEKLYKTTTIENNAEILLSDEYTQYYEDWMNALYEAQYATYSGTYKDSNGVTQTYTDVPSDIAYGIDKNTAYNDYMTKLAEYEDAALKYSAGVVVDLETALSDLAASKQKYSDTMTYDNWIKAKAAFDSSGNPTQVYLNSEKYYDVLAELLQEAENAGCTSLDELYVYSDEAKARWYTNLWYRLNGESSDKSAQGQNKTNYEVLDSRLATSSTWIQDALKQGIITLEASSYLKETNLIPDIDRPLSVQLKGITWRSTIYSSCSDFTELDDETAIAKAEAEYNRKNNEITAKDKKYDNKIKTLDTEHNTLQTEYESVQSAMNKNVERSFKAFS